MVMDFAMEEQPHSLGYGVGLRSPDSFINYIVQRYFGDAVCAGIPRDELIQEGRVATWMAEEELRAHGLPLDGGDMYRSTVVNKIAQHLRQYLSGTYRKGIVGRMPHRTVPVLSQLGTNVDECPLGSFGQDPTVADQVANEAWVREQLGLAEAILLDNRSERQGEHDSQVFRLWVLGFTTQEIAQRCNWLAAGGPRSVESALGRCILKLREYYGTDTSVPIVTSGTGRPGNNRGRSRDTEALKEYQRKYYRQHQKDLKERSKARMRQRRAAERAAHKQSQAALV